MKPDSTVTSLRPEFNVPFRQFREMPENMGYVGLRVLPPIEVTSKVGIYYMETLKSELRTGNVERNNDGSYNIVDGEFKQIDYRTKEFGLMAKLDANRVAAFARGMPEAEANEVLRLFRKIHRAIEATLCASLQDTTVFANAAAAGGTWSSHANSDPVADVAAAQAAIHSASGAVADTLVMSFRSYLRLIQSQKFVDRLKNWGGDDPKVGSMFADMSRIAKALGVGRVLVAGAVFDSAQQGQGLSLSTFWSNDKLGLYVTAKPGDPIDAACVGRVPTWGGDGGSIGEGDEPSLAVESWWSNEFRSWFYRTRGEADLSAASTIIYPQMGYIVTGIN